MSRRIGPVPEEPDRTEEVQQTERTPENLEETKTFGRAPAEEKAEPAAEEGAATEEAAPVEQLPEEEPEQKPKKKHTGLWVTIAAACAAACFGGYFFLNADRAVAAYDDQTQILDDGTFFQGVSVTGVDVSGMTMDEARQAIQEEAAARIADISVTYTVEGEEYTLGAEELGTALDTESVLNKAMELGRVGPFSKRHGEIATARNRGTDFQIAYTYDDKKIDAAVSEDLAHLADTARDAEVKLETTADEGSKTTGYRLIFTDEEAGIGVDQEKLVTEILTAAQNGESGPIAADVHVVEPRVTREDLEKMYTPRAVYSTAFSGSAEGRRYNIWKMSSIINGVEIQPGEIWSINEEAGPRTYALGWKGAPGISDGVYQEEAGGGICQVSSTLYNAVLRAEVDVAERTHHSWPLDYVPGGLDATISTGAPDFKIRNNLDVPIFLAVRCDGESARKVEVAIIGPEIGDGLTRDFYSELVATGGTGGTVEVYDSSLPSGSRQTLIRAHPSKTYNIYKRYLDEDGNQVGETELFMVDRYEAKPAKVRVGTG